MKTSTNLKIAIRFILSRKRSMLMSLAGIIFGVGFIIITQALTAGFQEFFIRTMLGVNSTMRVEDKLQETMRSIETEKGSGIEISLEEGKKYIPGVEYPDDITDAILRFREVLAVSTVIRGDARIFGNFRENSCKPYGIDLKNHLLVSDLENQLSVGTLDDFRRSAYGALLGRKLAQRMNLNVGDSIILDHNGHKVRFRISCIYETGIEQVDKERVFIHQPAARDLLKKPFGVSYLQIRIEDPSRAPQLSRRIAEVIGHHVSPWQQREKSWLELFKALRLFSAITVSTIILISGLGMFNTLVMIVMEKTKEISILRSMGFTRKDISSIFIWQGFLVLMSGIVLGWLFAFLGTWGITKIPFRIRGVISTDHFVVSWSIWHYLISAVVAFIIVMIASYFPARRAAQLEPGDVIRGTSS